MTRSEVYEEVLCRLDDVERDGDHATAPCPICSGSLIIRLGTFSPVTYCEDGCTQSEVFESLGVAAMVAALGHPKGQLRNHMLMLAETGLSDIDKLAFVALWAFTDDGGSCWPADESLGPLIARSPRSVPRMRKRLEAAGVLHTTPHGAPGTRKSNLYLLRQRAAKVRGIEEQQRAAKVRGIEEQQRAAKVRGIDEHRPTADAEHHTADGAQRAAEAGIARNLDIDNAQAWLEQRAPAARIRDLKGLEGIEGSDLGFSHFFSTSNDDKRQVVATTVTSTGVVYDDHHINRVPLFYTAGSSAGVFTSSPSAAATGRRALARLSADM